MTKHQKEIEGLQRDLNHFTSQHLKHVHPIRVDGSKGPSTNKRIKFCKYYLGYVHERVDAKAGHEFRVRLRHPGSVAYAHRFIKDPKDAKNAVHRGQRRRRVHDKKAQASYDLSHRTSGVGHFDGVPVANWLIPYLQWAREHGWNGRLVSGWRDPVYSEHLCYNMCGRPSCSGRCAGRSSNHSGSVKPHGAVDVTYYQQFAALMRRCPLSPHIFNALGARDPVHFSSTGN